MKFRICFIALSALYCSTIPAFAAESACSATVVALHPGAHVALSANSSVWVPSKTTIQSGNNSRINILGNSNTIKLRAGRTIITVSPDAAGPADNLVTNCQGPVPVRVPEKQAITPPELKQEIFHPKGTAGDDLPEYAPIKQNMIGMLHTITPRSEFKGYPPITSPQHGIIIARGSFISRGGSFTVVDLDALTINWIGTTSQILPDGTFELIIAANKKRPLSDAETKEIILQANDVWNPPPKKPLGFGGMVTDSSCDVVLLDKQEAKHLMGMGCPAGDLIKVIDKIKP